MSIILIKQIPDDYAESIGLDKFNRSRLPSCKDKFVAALNRDNRYVTGIDEDSFLIDKTKKDEIKAKRLDLERVTGKDLSGTSTFWQDFYVTIESDLLKRFDTDNAYDVISYNLLLANNHVAPSKDDISDPRYKDCQYYSYTVEGEVKQEINERKKGDLALAELTKIAESKEKMVLYGQYLEGLKYNESLGDVILYKMLRDFIEQKEPKFAAAFLAALKKSPEELQKKVLVDRALKARLIKHASIGNKKFAYQYGQVTLGVTIEDVYKNLSSVEFSPELVAIKEQLDRKK